MPPEMRNRVESLRKWYTGLMLTIIGFFVTDMYMGWKADTKEFSGYSKDKIIYMMTLQSHSAELQKLNERVNSLEPKRQYYYNDTVFYPQSLTTNRP